MVTARTARCGQVCLLGVGLLLAGCQGFVDEPATTETPTVTPAPVPEQEPTGLSAGEVDAGPLAEGHRAALSRTNYTLTVTERLFIDGEPRRVTTRTRRVGRGGRAYLVTRTERTNRFAPSNYAGMTGYWYDGSTELIRYAADARRRYDRSDSPGNGLLDDPTEARTVAGTVRAFDTEATAPRQLADGSFHVRVEGLARPNRIPELGYFVSPRNGTLRLTVDQNGFVRWARLAYDATLAGTDRQVHVVRELTVTDVGETAVDPPGWAGRARSPAEAD